MNLILRYVQDIYTSMIVEDKEWYLDGKLHRADGPAVEQVNGYKAWYIKGQRHRVDGPAVERGRYKAWYINGERHRVDGPATVYSNGDRLWFFKGRLHREDGPAVEYTDGSKKWCYNGVETTELIQKMTIVMNKRKWKRLIAVAARKWALKIAIEWKPPMGIQYMRMMNEYEH